MRTIRVTVNEDLVSAVDGVVKRLGTSRSAFVRTVLKEAVKRARIIELERKHREGYARKPVAFDEFDIWDV